MSPKDVFQTFWRKKKVLAVFVLLVIAVGETWMRLPFILHRLEYEPDLELNGRLAPNQRGFMWLGSMSIPSPPITINSDGHRGAETRWSDPVILALGASNTFGAGVKDRETWAFVLQELLNKEHGLENLQVVNAAHPGHGPSHQLVRLHRVMHYHTLSCIIVRVGAGMFNFRVPPEAERQLRLEQSIQRQRIRKLTKFLPFLYNKLEIQFEGLGPSLIPAFLRPKLAEASRDPSVIGRRMWDDNLGYWEEMIEMSLARGIPIVFSVWDPLGSEDGIYLVNHMRGLCKEKDYGTVQYLGPGLLNMEEMMPKYREKEFREKYTLRLDRHINALQHKLIAKATFEFFCKNNLLERLRTQSLTLSKNHQTKEPRKY